MIFFLIQVFLFFLLLLGIPRLFAYVLAEIGEKIQEKKKEEEKKKREEHNEKTPDEEFNPEDYKSPGITIGLGTEIPFGIAYLSILFWYIQWWVLSWIPLEPDGFQYWVVMSGVVIALLIWAIAGFFTIPVAWKGALTFIGGRIPPVVVAEGPNWLPRGILSVIPVNLKEMALDITEKGSILSQNKVRFFIDITVTYRVFNPHAFLAVGMEMVDKGVHDLALSRVRDHIVSEKDEEVFRMRDELRLAILQSLDEKSDKWGIFVTKIPINTIVPFSPEVTAAYEKDVVERDEAIGETREAEFNVNMQKMYQEKLGLSPEAAAALHSGERGKDTKISVISVNGKSSLHELAAILSGIGQKGGDK